MLVQGTEAKILELDVGDTSLLLEAGLPWGNDFIVPNQLQIAR
jgi:hypothetical protein